MVASVVTGTFFCQFILSRPGLISIYLAGEDKSTKKISATTESTINVDIERPDDGNVLIAGQILSNQQAKISWSLVTP
jgi:hypothetical protein